MPKYYVEVNCLGNEENYEIWADSKEEAEKIAQEKSPDNAFRWTRVRNEAEKKSDDGQLLATGLVIVPALAIRGLWVGAKSLWKGGKFAYRVARNPEIVSNYIETKRKAIEKNNELRKEKFEELVKSRQISVEERNRISRQMWISGAKFFLRLIAMFVVALGLMILLRR